jgi:hypothetical protein
MLGSVTNFFSANANTIVRDLGFMACVGSCVHFVYAEQQGANKSESFDTKVQRLALHNVAAVASAMVTLATLPVVNKMGAKTRVFCMLCLALPALYPTVKAGSALYATQVAKKPKE